VKRAVKKLFTSFKKRMPVSAKIYRVLNSKDKKSKNEYLAYTGKYFTK
jgi:hypothetical protein